MEELKVNKIKKELNLEGLTQKQINFIIKDCKRKGIRATKNVLIKESKKENIKRNLKHVRQMTITIDWRKSSVYGYNPHATVTGIYTDNTSFYETGFTCSGCGYDKRSTVIAQIFNKYLIYKIYKVNSKKRIQKPYGVYLQPDFLYPFFGDGIGLSAYENITKWLNGKAEIIVNTNYCDVISFSFKGV